MKIKIKLISFFILPIVFLSAMGIFLAPETALAQDCPQEGVEGIDFLVFNGPLVPCGRQSSCEGNEFNNNQMETCTLCHLIILAKNIFDLVLSLLIIVSLVMITAAGVLYIVSTGSPNLKTMAKKIITKTLTGFGIFLLSWLFVFAVLQFMSYNTEIIGHDDNWFDFQCNTQSRFWRESSGDSGNLPQGPDVDDPVPTDPAREQEVRDRLAAAGITVNNPPCTGGRTSGCTDVDGLRDETIDELIAFKENCGADCTVVVTGGSEGGHSGGTYSHHNGYKADIRLTSSAESYIRNNYTHVGTRGDGAAIYHDGSGNYYYRESNHWDICYGCPAPTA